MKIEVTVTNNKRKLLQFFAIGLFLVYLLILIRIVLFKQVALYNLFAAIGSMERTINIIPFKSLFDMINDNVSVTRILENILGNVAIFIPFGLLLPIVQKDKSKRIILYGLIASAFIEIIQYILKLGSSDIDDLLFNTLGSLVGYIFYKIIRQKTRTDTSSIIAIIVLVTILSSVALCVLFINHTELFLLSQKEIVVENAYLVQDFIDTLPTVSGKFVQVSGNILTVEKNVRNSTDTRTLVDFEITQNSNIYICYDKIDYLFSAISGERVSYEQIKCSDLLSQKNSFITNKSNLQIWSSDGSTINNLVIIEWST